MLQLFMHYTASPDSASIALGVGRPQLQVWPTGLVDESCFSFYCSEDTRQASPMCWFGY